MSISYFKDTDIAIGQNIINGHIRQYPKGLNFVNPFDKMTILKGIKHHIIISNITIEYVYDIKLIMLIVDLFGSDETFKEHIFKRYKYIVNNMPCETEETMHEYFQYYAEKSNLAIIITSVVRQEKC